MADERPGAALSGNAKKAVARKTSRRTADDEARAPRKRTPSATAKQAAAKQAAATKAPAKQSATKKAATRKAAAKKSTAKKTTTAKSTTAKRATATKAASTQAPPPATPETTASERVVRTASTSGRSGPDRRPAPVRLVSAAADTTLQVASLPANAARSVLDRRGGLPAYLGAGALAVAGVVEWPVAVGASAGYAALRRWGNRLPQPLRSLTGSNRSK